MKENGEQMVVGRADEVSFMEANIEDSVEDCSFDFTAVMLIH